MKTLKTLVGETQQLVGYVKKTIPIEVSQAWLSTAQNAFLAESDPSTGRRWADRHGLVYGKGFRQNGNVESYLSYKKLQRTGRLLRGLKVKRTSITNGTAIELYNNVSYASEHEEGGQTAPITIKKPYVKNGATGIVTGGNVVARPFMKPSKQVLRTPQLLLEERMRKNGWSKSW